MFSGMAEHTTVSYASYRASTGKDFAGAFLVSQIIVPFPRLVPVSQKCGECRPGQEISTRGRRRRRCGGWGLLLLLLLSRFGERESHKAMGMTLSDALSGAP